MTLTPWSCITYGWTVGAAVVIAQVPDGAWLNWRGFSAMVILVIGRYVSDVIAARETYG